MAVHAVTALAAERVRQGGGPALIEAQTYRFGGHSRSDAPERYRSKDELETWQSRDPLTRMANFLREVGVDDEFFLDLDEQSDTFAASVRKVCSELTGEPLLAMFDNVYAEPHPGLLQDRDNYVATMAKEY